MDKNKIETICRRAGMRPETRVPYKDYEIFVADGFSLPPHRNFQRFGVEPLDFPSGMYATLWWVSKKEEQLDTGQPIFFDAHHGLFGRINREYDMATMKRARINTAIKEATGFLNARKNAVAN